MMLRAIRGGSVLAGHPSKYRDLSPRKVTGTIVAGVVLAVVGLVLFRGTVQLAGTNDRLEAIIRKSPGCHPPLNMAGMFWSDVVLIVGYLMVGTVVLAAGWWR
jgi:hypothetical protein